LVSTLKDAQKAIRAALPVANKVKKAEEGAMEGGKRKKRTTGGKKKPGKGKGKK
jgi:hypothetical protein